MCHLIMTAKYEQVGNITWAFTVEGTGFQAVIPARVTRLTNRAWDKITSTETPPLVSSLLVFSSSHFASCVDGENTLKIIIIIA